MLSRVAERMYWLGRQVERLENISRLINVNGNLLLDMPRIGKEIWGGLIDITGSNEGFYNKYVRADERNVTRFLVADDSNPGSLLSTIILARENARVTREIMPIESWEKINECYLYVKRNTDKSQKRDGRYRYLNNVITYCHQITGLWSGGLSHGAGYSFLRIGRNLERADMGTRIVDVGCLNLLRENENIPDSYDDLLWMNVLRSLSAYQMYRQNVKDRVNGEDVAEFLLKNTDFPRSVAHCLGEIFYCFSKLPRNDIPLRSITHTQRLVNEAKIAELIEKGLHEFIDEIQIDIAELHTHISHTWFGHELEPQAISIKQQEQIT